MEAADDIAYCLSDIEDGIEKEVIRLEDLIIHIAKTIPNAAQELWDTLIEGAEKNKKTIEKFIFIRTNLINRSVELASNTYLQNEASILKGNFETSLLQESAPETLILESARTFVAQYVYSSPEAEIIELSGNSVITGILDKLSPLLTLSAEDFQRIIKKDSKHIKEQNFHIQARLTNLLPSQSLKCYQTESKRNQKLEWIYRAHLIIDYISGMTDDYALDIFQKLSGIKTV